jgi:hypothetical protein
MTVSGIFRSHAKHYKPLYGLVVVMVVVVAAFPSVVPGDRGTGSLGPDASGGSPTANGSPSGSDGRSPVASPSEVSGSGRRHSTDTTSTGSQPGLGLSGRTHGGVMCRPGVRQIPWSVYTPLCLPKFTGKNGGATYRGVTKDTIKFVVRRLPGDTVVGPIASSQGLGDPEKWDEARRKLTPFFNRMYELYGRKVVIETYTGSGNTFDELNEEGADAACKDAKEIASMDVFGVLPWGPAGTSGPFSRCAAKEGLFVPFGALFFPETSYQDWHPYVWGGVLPAADDIGHDAAEYIGKRLAGRKAAWAGDEEATGQNFRARPRTFGMFVPRSPSYRVLGDAIEGDGRSTWGFTVTSRYDYENNPATLGASVNAAIAQFKAAGVTTIILASDFLSMKLLTRRAAAQNYFPEWFTVGIAWTDFESVARECDRRAVDGHLFGMSQFGGPKMYDPKGEVFRTWRIAAPGQEAPEFMPFVYYFMVDMFNKLQLAGPNLTPHAVATGSKRYAGGSARAAMGRWSYAIRHSTVSDSREVYWDADAVAFDGNRGAYLETYNGRRFDRGEWTREAPPIYPGS